jgi:hypothetical protein
MTWWQVLLVLVVFACFEVVRRLAYRRGYKAGKKDFDKKIGTRFRELQGLVERSGLSIEALPPELREGYQGSWTGMSVRDPDTRPAGVPSRWDEVTRSTGR